MSQWITEIFEKYGYVGLGLVMCLENIFPPIPSEAVLPAAGIAARGGAMNPFLALLVAVVGSLLGVIPWYFVGRMISREKLVAWTEQKGWYLGIRRSDLDRSFSWFERHGSWAVMIGRIIPGIRTLISVPAGMAAMPFWKFLLYSAIGTTAWSGALLGVGYWLGKDASVVEAVIKYAGYTVFGLIGLWIIYRLVKFGRRHRAKT